MGFLDAIWHLLNFFAPAVLLGALSAAMTKLLWWRDLKGVSWRGLWAWSATSAAVVTVGGLVFFGRDGKIVTYAAMVLVSALSLWWAAFGPRRR
jgi:hypothetical protein